MSNWTPKKYETCLMAIGSSEKPPHNSFYEKGKVKKINRHSFVWVGPNKSRNVLKTSCCVFKPINA